MGANADVQKEEYDADGFEAVESERYYAVDWSIH